METPSISQIQPQDGVDRSKDVADIVTGENPMITCSEDDRFIESLLTLLNGQQDLQRQALNMMQNMNHRHKHDNLMQDIPIYDGKNIDLADWLLK